MIARVTKANDLKNCFRIMLTLALLVLGQQTMAQLQLADSSNWQLATGLAGRYNGGNFKRFIISPDLTVAYQNRSYSFGFSSATRYTYGTFGSFITERDLLSRNFVYYNQKQRVHPFMMAWVQTYELSRLALRQQYGIGLTLAALRQRNHQLKTSLMASVEFNKFNGSRLTILDQVTDGQYQTIRATAYVSGQHKFNQGLLAFNYECYWQPSVQQFDNQRLFIDAGFSWLMTKQLALKLSYQYDYSSVRVLGLEPVDELFVFGLNYRLINQ